LDIETSRGNLIPYSTIPLNRISSRGRKRKEVKREKGKLINKKEIKEIKF
jgi:hypothetical protein